MIEKEQALIATVLDILAEQFGQRAILRGGMALRIIGSPRFTNDLDYIFVPYKSKKDIVEEVITCLGKIEGTELSHSLNSKCLRVVITREDATIQVEAKVAMESKTSLASTRLFSKQFNIPPRMICIADHSTALANKLAAWNEHRLARDLYDIWFFLQMNIQPDQEILMQRLRKPVYSKLIKEADYFPGPTASDFYEFIRQKTSQLSDQDITDALSDYLPPEETEGLALQINAALVKLR